MDRREISFRDRIKASPTSKFTRYGILPTKMIIHSLIVVVTSLQVLLVIGEGVKYANS
jgi:hypothetical protein